MFPRVIALTSILVLGSATISFAAENTLLTPTPKAEPAPVTPLVTVPDVRGQAYVFAKGTLEERGFAWRVVGAVRGYAANKVVAQTPAAGTRIVDTGLPKILLGLERNGSYAQEGTPEDASPYAGTKIELPRAKPKVTKPVAKPKPKVTKPAAKPKAKLVAKPKAKSVAKPKTKPKAKPKPRPRAKPKPVAARRPAFAGGPKEPLDEMTLPARARRLERWLAGHSKPTRANVRHWFYQHEWVVTGAKFGWWHGAEALRILIRVDEQVQRRWGIGAKSETAARRVLALVRAKAR
jgi:PASTA domain